MQEAMIMRAIFYDSIQLSGLSKYLMFQDDDDVNSPKFTEVIEQQVVRWLFNHPFKIANYLFFEELGISQTLSKYFEVQKPVIKDSFSPGDIDILFTSEKNPEKSIAFQVKRVKGRVNDNNEMNLKTSNLVQGVKQAKFMYEKYRFHRNYLMLAVVSDLHGRVEQSQISRYPSLTEKKVLYNHAGFADLPSQVGLYVLEINQSSINHVDQTAIIASKMFRDAERIEQPAITTESVTEFLKSRKSL